MAVSNGAGKVATSITEAIARQRFYFAGSGRLQLALAGNVRALIENPAGSGRNLYVVRMSGLATGIGWADLLLNPTTGIPSTTRTVNNAVLGASSGPVGVVRTDVNTTTPLSGGTNTGVVLGIPSGSRFQIDLPPFVLAPGVSLGINNAFAGSADFGVSIYWYEENV